MRLHWLERKLLLALKEKPAYTSEVAEKTQLKEDSVLRAASMLKEKGLVRIAEEKETLIGLGSEGKIFSYKGLPERRLINAILKVGREMLLDEAIRSAGLTKEEENIAIGWAKRKGWIDLRKEKEGIMVTVKEAPIGSDEKLISKLAEGTIAYEKLPKDLLDGLKILRRRPNAIEEITRTRSFLDLSDKGEKISKGLRMVKEVTLLTPALIRTGRWRKVRISRFDVEAPGPTIYPGKIHPVQQIIREVREAFLHMGFVEIRGPIVETAFWNFDALFQPQDHPAREMMDTFYLAEPEFGKLPSKIIVDRVKRTHEDGWITGSTGWGYRWELSEAKRLVMRTHTTAATIRYLATHREPPVRVFSVDRVYRNEKVDPKHLAEFHQIEGIVMEEGITLRDLMGILKEFYRKLGLKGVQFWPSYFPYTEPSVQSTVYVPEMKAWIELCGMGIFRPEVLKPLGIKYPVLAWGGGLERLIMLKLGVDDMRYLYRNDLSWLRRIVCRPLL